MTLYASLLRPLLFRLEAEHAHDLALRSAGALARSAAVRQLLLGRYGPPDPRLATDLGGFRITSPVGLGAGLDKNGIAAPFLSCLGFGFIEVGSVSAAPSPGNRVRPRLWRLPADESLMVYYGVPSEGAVAVAPRIAAAPKPVPLGLSIVETNRGAPTALHEVIEDFASAASMFAGTASYLALNLHCPNSGGAIGHFDSPANLARLLSRLSSVPHLPPLFIKITPPADQATTDEFLRAVDPFPRVAGFILNTHAIRPYTYISTPQSELATMRGSMTGPHLRAPVEAALRDWYRRIDRTRHMLIAVGGVGTADDAYRLIRLGASAVQLVTALVYRGPGLIADINRGLAALIERDGFASIKDAIGVDNRETARRPLEPI